MSGAIVINDPSKELLDDCCRKRRTEGVVETVDELIPVADADADPGAMKDLPGVPGGESTLDPST